MLQCADAPVCECSSVRMLQCANAPVCECFSVRMLQCANAPCANAPVCKCSSVRMLQYANAPESRVLRMLQFANSHCHLLPSFCHQCSEFLSININCLSVTRNYYFISPQTVFKESFKLDTFNFCRTQRRAVKYKLTVPTPNLLKLVLQWLVHFLVEGLAYN